jgi:hypothetical protein
MTQAKGTATDAARRTTVMLLELLAEISVWSTPVLEPFHTYEKGAYLLYGLLLVGAWKVQHCSTEHDKQGACRRVHTYEKGEVGQPLNSAKEPRWPRWQP